MDIGYAIDVGLPLHAYRRQPESEINLKLKLVERLIQGVEKVTYTISNDLSTIMLGWKRNNASLKYRVHISQAASAVLT
jgi:hypothetical protein